MDRRTFLKGAVIGALVAGTSGKIAAGEKYLTVKAIKFTTFRNYYLISYLIFYEHLRR